MVIPCETCAGTGEISEERARWISEGRRLHRYRLVAIYRSQRQAAIEYGVTFRRWADAEAGRVDPAPLIARVLDRR